MINKAVLAFVALILTTAQMSAQDKASMNLRFVYVAHEVSTPVAELCAKLNSLRDDAFEANDQLVIYLSDGRNSQMSFTNIKDEQGRERDKKRAFTQIIGSLQESNSHNVVASDDMRNIIELFDS